MAQANKIEDPRINTEKLRGLRLADEAARKAAGTWGELSVGEVTHRPSGAVFLQIWKGARRPAVAGATNSRVAGVPAAEWPAVAAWLETVRAEDLHRSIIAWSVSKAEAQRLKAMRMAEHRAAGLTIVNPAEPAEA